MNKSLYNDLYNSTSIYKTDKAKSSISKFIFKPTVNNTVGFNNIDPNIIYASSTNKIFPKDIDISDMSESCPIVDIAKAGKAIAYGDKKYYKIPYSSIYNTYINNNFNGIKIDGLDVAYITSDNILYKLYQYELNKTKKFNISNPDKSMSLSISDIYDKEYGVEEFYNITGIYFEIIHNGLVKYNNVNVQSYYHRIPNFRYKFNDDNNIDKNISIKISINSLDKLSIWFYDEHILTNITTDIDNIYQLNFYTNMSSYEISNSNEISNNSVKNNIIWYREIPKNITADNIDSINNSKYKLFCAKNSNNIIAKDGYILQIESISFPDNSIKLFEPINIAATYDALSINKSSLVDIGIIDICIVDFLDDDTSIDELNITDVPEDLTLPNLDTLYSIYGYITIIYNNSENNITSSDYYINDDDIEIVPEFVNGKTQYKLLLKLNTNLGTIIHNIIPESTDKNESAIKITIQLINNKSGSHKSINEILGENILTPIGDNIPTMDELIERFPFSMRDILERNSKLNITKIDKIHKNNIIDENGIKYIKYSIVAKHNSIMFFKNGTLIIPDKIERETLNSITIPGYRYYIYINTDNIPLTKDEEDDEYYKVSNDIDFYIVSDYNELFIEDNRFDVIPISKTLVYTDSIIPKVKFKISESDYSDEYPVYAFDNNEKMYVELSSDNMTKFKNNSFFFRYKSDNIVYYISFNKDIKDIDQTIYTNEYLLPINKDINPDNIILSIETFDHEGSTDNGYCRNPNGAYIYLDSEVTYVVNGKEVIYGPGYVVPPEYKEGNIRYSKCAIRCTTLSDLYNIRYIKSKGYNKRFLYNKDKDNLIDYGENSDIQKHDEFSYIYKFIIMEGTMVTNSFSELDANYNNDKIIIDGGVFIKDNINNLSTNTDLTDNEVLYDFNINTALITPPRNIKAYQIDSSFSDYELDNDKEFLAYKMPNQLINSKNRLLTFLNGIFSDEYYINPTLHSKLFHGDTIISFPNNLPSYIVKDGEEQPIKNVYMCNMKNLIIYQNANGIDYKNGYFTVNPIANDYINSIRYPYKTFYYIPLSTKYMIFFINGRFANPYINILSPTRFTITNIEKMFGSYKDNIDSYTISDIEIYTLSDYMYYMNDYIDYYTHYDESNNKVIEKEDIYLKDIYTDSIIYDEGKKNIDYSIYKYYDRFWNKYSGCIIDKNKTDIENTKMHIIDYKPRTRNGEYDTDSIFALYEIFGKYVLNSSNIDGDNEDVLRDEIYNYFKKLYDDDGRMKLELMQDKTRRKYIY